VRYCAALLVICMVTSAPAWGEGTALQSDKTFVLHIESAAKEPLLLRTQKGDRVRLEVEANRPVVLHIHGLGIEIVAEPGRPGETHLTAKTVGRFPIHVHETADPAPAKSHSHRTPFAYLEVHPK
jgi:FtsP/CotA-like multicopper oxidase with cupredoxin domain